MRTSVRFVAAAIAVAVVGLVPVGRVEAVGSGADCGGGDTPPAHQLTSGTSCAGSLDEAHSSTGADLNGNTVYNYGDVYTFDHTDGDRVQVAFTGTSCMSHTPSGTYIAAGTGTTVLDVTARRNATPEGTPIAPCPEQPGDYSVRVTVTPNDRPAVTSATVPASGQYGETIQFEVSGTDPDGNLRSLGVRYGGPSQSIQWQDQLIASASWTTTFDHPMYYDVDVTFFARDSLGAISPASATYHVALIQDDCGWGTDANGQAVTLPFHCEGLWPDISDVDSFTFTLPADRRARVRTLVAYLDSLTVRLTSPSGAVTQTASDDVITAAEAGTWRLDLLTGGDNLTYEVDIRSIGLAAPPALLLEHSPVTHQGDYFALPMTGFDPNDETLVYRVAWSDGPVVMLPADGSRALSGQTQTAYRRFVSETPTSFSGTVTVTNSEGLSDTEPFSVTVVPHNDCGFGAPTYDAPGSGNNLRTMPPDGICSASVGHLLPNPLAETPDAADAYISSQTCSVGDCKLRATLTTSPGLAASVRIDNFLQAAATSCGFGGCTTRVDLLGPSWPANQYPRVIVTADGGKGSYTVRIEKLRITDDLL